MRGPLICHSFYGNGKTKFPQISFAFRLINFACKSFARLRFGQYDVAICNAYARARRNVPDLSGYGDARLRQPPSPADLVSFSKSLKVARYVRDSVPSGSCVRVP